MVSDGSVGKIKTLSWANRSIALGKLTHPPQRAAPSVAVVPSASITVSPTTIRRTSNVSPPSALDAARHQSYSQSDIL